MRCELITDPDMAGRGVRMLEAMLDTAPMEMKVRTQYKGDCELLMVYGMGHPLRRPWWQKHVKRGGRCIGWDLGYWNRDEATMRLTIDTDHPQQWLRPESDERWRSAAIPLRNDTKLNGPVIIVGMSAKANRVHLMGRLNWEMRTFAAVRKAYPGRQVLFRPKRDSDPVLAACLVARGPIEDVLRGASLVVCRHSNVGVDACIAGVPVVCEDGAAAALYGSDLANPLTPTLEQRQGFLESLAWWQWKPKEAAQAWTYLLSRL